MEGLPINVSSTKLFVKANVALYFSNMRQQQLTLLENSNRKHRF